PLRLDYALVDKNPEIFFIVEEDDARPLERGPVKSRGEPPHQASRQEHCPKPSHVIDRRHSGQPRSDRAVDVGLDREAAISGGSEGSQTSHVAHKKSRVGNWVHARARQGHRLNVNPACAQFVYMSIERNKDDEIIPSRPEATKQCPAKMQEVP